MADEARATLEVWLDGVKVAELTAGCPPYTFGRGRDADLRLGPSGDRADLDVSRIAGAVHAQYGYWAVDNVGSRPIEISLPVQDWLAPGSTWAVGPDGTELEVPSPKRPKGYRILLRPKGGWGPFGRTSTPYGDPAEPATYPLPAPTPHERTLLAAKFLSRPRPGLAIGNDLAARRLAAVRYPATARAVEDCARRWKERLEGFGVRGVDGRENANRLGGALLRFGVLRQEHALDLPPVEDDG